MENMKTGPVENGAIQYSDEVIYARQSLDKRDSISINGQIEACQKLTTDPDANNRVIEDRGYSGKNLERPGFNELMVLVRTGHVKKVIIYRLDRVSRSLLDFSKLMDEFKMYGVQFVSATEQFDTTTPMGQAMLSIVMVFAELERKTIQLRVTDNYYNRGERGMYLGGPAPYGFIKETNRVDGVKQTYLVPDKETIGNILDMYELYTEEGLSLGEISKAINERGITAPKGGNWDGGKISRMLHNPAYVKADADVYAYFKDRGCTVTNGAKEFTGEYGCYLYGKREASERKYRNVEGHKLSIAPHKGVIDAEQWLKCQVKLDGNTQIGGAGKGQYSWLSGLVKCGKCGYCMTVSHYEQYNYFICRGKHLLNNCTGQKMTQHVDIIEEYVKNELFKRLKKLPKVEIAKDKKAVCTNNADKLKLLGIEEEIDELVNKISVISGAAIKIVNQRINDLDAERCVLIHRLSKEIKDAVENPFEEIVALADHWDTAPMEEKKIVAKALIKRVSLNEKEIKIEWKA